LVRTGPWAPRTASILASAAYGFDPGELVEFANDRYAFIASQMPNFLPVRSCDPAFPDRRATMKRLPTGADHQAQVQRVQRYVLYPTILLHDNSNRFAVERTDELTWLQNRESLLARMAKSSAQYVDSVGSYWQGDYEFLFDQNVSMADNGRWFLCMALSSKHQETSRLAIDALISAVSDCRIDATTFGAAMAALVPTGVITAVRWTRALRELGKVSAWHRYFVFETCKSFLKDLGTSGTQSLGFLEVLLETQSQLNVAADAELREIVSKYQGSGKGGKIAKSIFGFAPIPTKGSGARSAAAQALEIRIARAQSWQTLLKARLAEETAIVR